MNLGQGKTVIEVAGSFLKPPSQHVMSNFKHQVTHTVLTGFVVMAVVKVAGHHVLHNRWVNLPVERLIAITEVKSDNLSFLIKRQKGFHRKV